LAIVSGRIWTYQKPAMKPTGSTMSTTQEMILANPSMRSGGKKEAFARPGMNKKELIRASRVVFFMFLISMSW
jgi:hypothetical protein